MTDLSPRETAARAMFGQRWTGMTFGRHPDLEDDCREVADAVLAAVAAHDGLADVLGRHIPIVSTRDAIAIVGCARCDDWTPPARTDWDALAAHLADVVRAWMVQM